MFCYRWSMTAGLTVFILVCAIGMARTTVAADREESEVKTQLGRMLEAMRSRNYLSRVVHAQGSRLETFEVWHRAGSSWETEHWMALDGPARVLVRQGNPSLSTLPEKTPVPIDAGAEAEAVQYQQRVFGGQPADIASLVQYYRFAQLGDSRVAGRVVQVIGLIPRDPWRYGRRYSIDQDSALPLRTDMTDAKGLPVEQFLFTSIILDPPPAALPSWPPDAARAALEGRDPPPKVATAVSPWVFTQLPPGFQLQHQVRLSRPSGYVDHSVLGDGLSSVSVYVEPAENEGTAPVDLALGGTHALSRRLGAFHIIALGEVPAATLRAILDGLHPETPAQ